jgi:hypothetical protein
MDDPARTRDRTAPDDRRLHELPPYLVAGNRYGSYGFGAGLTGLLLTLAPFGHTLAWPFLVVAVVLGATGFVHYAQDTATNRDTAVVDLAMGWVGLVVLIAELSVELGVPPTAYGYGP